MEAKIQIDRQKAVTLCGIINLMTGPVGFRAKREEVQAKIKALWPEILEADVGDLDRKEKRALVLNEREQKAMGEGLLTLVRKSEANGADFSNCLELAEVLRIKGWYKKATTVEEVPEFEGVLDDEPDIADLDTEEEPASPEE